MRKQITGGIILSLIAQMISIIVALVYTPIMIKILGQNEYGLYQYVTSIVNYLNLMNLGFNGAYIRYYVLAAQKNSETEIANVNGMFLKIFLFIMTLCLIAGGFIYCNIGVLGDHLTKQDYSIAKMLLVLMVLNLSISFPNSIFVAFMSANERFVYQKVLNIIINILTPIASIPLLLIGAGSVGVVSVTLSLNILRFVMNVWYCLKKLDMKVNFGYFDNLVFKELLSYTFFIFLSDLVDQMNSNVDNFLLGRKMGTSAVAIYSVGYNLKNYYTIISWLVPEMFIPEVNRLANDDSKSSELTDVFIKVGKLNNYLVLLVLSGFFLVGNQFIILWIGEEYEKSYYVALILMISGYVPAIQTLGVNIQTAKNMHRMRSIIYFFVACMNVIMSVFLIEKFGVIGTCMGTLGAIIIGNVFFMNYYYHKKIGLDIFKFWKSVAKWIICVLIITICGRSFLGFVELNTWTKLVIFCVSYGLIYVTVLYTIELKKNQKHFLKKIIVQLLNRKKR